MFLYDIIKVIYSPIKAFREILENPRYIGPAIIIIISLLLTVGTQYVSVSKHYVEAITPSTRAAWTNMTDPSTMWTSNGTVANILVTSNITIGTYSVITSIHNNSEIWLKTTNIGTINCSEDSGFKALYYKLMYVSVQSQNLTTATLRLYSFKNEGNYFKFDLLSSERYLNKSVAWIDANVTLVSGWTVGGGSPDWSNITGIEFRLNFPKNDTLSLQLNDLYFGGKYESWFDALGSSDWLINTLMSSIFDIFLRWLIFAALLWLTIKTFNPEGGQFKTLLIIVGYSFAIMLVYIPFNMLSISQLPALHFPHRVVFPASARETELANTATSNIYAANWSSTTPYMVYFGISIASYIWTVGLFTIALKTLKNFSWKKSLAMGLIAWLMGWVLLNIVSSLGF